MNTLSRFTDSRVVFAAQLLDRLTSEGIRYVLVGDVRDFPLKIPSDIDIVIDSSCLTKFLRTLSLFCEENHAKIVQVLQHEQSAWYWICAWMDNENILQFLHPDVCTDFFRDGVLFLHNHELLGNRRLVSSQADLSFSFYIPAPPQGFLYYLLKKVDKGNISPKEGEYLSLEWKKDPEGTRDQLKRFWNPEIIELLARAANDEKWDPIQKNLPRIKGLLRKNRPFSIHHHCSEMWRKFKRILQPTGLHVVFLGIDGTGKSTILTKVQHDIAPAFRNVRMFHFRPFFGKRQGHSSENRHPHLQPRRGRLSSLGKIVWYLLDHTVGYIVFVFSYLIRSTLVLFDRHFYDIIVDPQRYRYNGPRWLANFLAKFIPRPDLIFLLDASPQVINARKQEISITEMIRLREAYLQFSNDFENTHVVDVSKTTEEVEREVTNIIVNFLSMRTMQRLRL